MKLSRYILITAVLCAGLFAAEPAKQPEHPAVQLYTQPIDDSLAWFNRPMESFNAGVVQYVLHPIAKPYKILIPEAARTGFKNVGNNLLFPLRLVTNLLQGKGGRAWDETKRFGINTTVGILGWNDKAHDMGIKPTAEDFGQTLATWGVGTGCYVNLPLLGPSNVRDSITKIPDFLLDGSTYIPVFGTFLSANSLFASESFLYGYFAGAEHTYPTTRAAFTLSREALVKDGIFPKATSKPDESLGVLKLKPSDSFALRAKELEITLPGAKNPLPFTLFKHKKSDGRIMFILPGLSSTRMNSDIIAMAEIYHKQGWTVAIISSTFTPEFISATTNPLPGLIHLDCENLDNALTAIKEHILTKEYVHNQRLQPRVAVFGVSLGAINTLYLAARDFQKKSTLKADKFIAVNPPRNPMNALRKLDSCFDIPMQWPEDQRIEKTRLAVQKITYAVMNPKLADDVTLDLDESRFIIGLNCRMGLMQILFSIAKSDQKELLQKHLRFDDIEAFEKDAFAMSYLGYIEKILLPYAQKTGLTKDNNVSMESLENIYKLDQLAPHLLPNPKVVLFHNQNDFLLDEGDISWFQATLPKRCFIFPQGGHLGNLFVPQVQEALVKAAQ